MLVDNITTEPTWTSTIQVTSERSECDTSTSRATTSGSLLSTLTRYVHPTVGILEEDRREKKGGLPAETTNLTHTQLWSLVPAEKRDSYLAADSKQDTVPVLDLLPLGYSKVLGKGRIPQVPIVVRARWFSKEAERKITEAGGVVELVA